MITGYKIRYRRHDRRNHPLTLTTEGNRRFYVLPGLDKGVGYQVRICTINANGTGPFTEWLNIETYENDLTETQVPNAPSKIESEYAHASFCLTYLRQNYVDIARLMNNVC